MYCELIKISPDTDKVLIANLERVKNPGARVTGFFVVLNPDLEVTPQCQQEYYGIINISGICCDKFTSDFHTIAQDVVW